MKPTKAQLIALMYAWIAQRPGLEFGNYGDVSAYRSEMRSITKDLHTARTLLRQVELSGISADELLDAFRAFSGRLSVVPHGDGFALDYCTGQYWPTEYRRAACAVLASVLWAYKADYCMPEPVLMHNSETGETLKRYQDMRAGDWLRAKFRKEYGRGIQQTWFN